MPISQKLKRQIVNAIRAEISGVSQVAVPRAHDVPPDQWTKEDSERVDMLADVERKTVAAVEKLLAQ